MGKLRAIPPRRAPANEMELGFRTIAEAMPQLVWSATPEGTVDYFNQRWIDYTGLTAEELRKKDGAVGVVHPDDFAETWKRWKASLASGEPYEVEHRLRKKADGGYRWFLNRGVPMVDQRGRITRWIGTATDIDEQRRSRDHLSFMVEAGSALAASLNVEEICNTLARVTVEKFCDWCFVVLQRDGVLGVASAAHRSADLAQHVADFLKRYLDQAEDPMAKAMAARSPVLVEKITTDGSARSFIVAPLAAPDGSVYGAVNMIAAESGRIFTDTDLKVAATVASRAAVAIETALAIKAERRAAQRMAFAGRINQLLLETTELWTTLERIAEMIAADVADACAVARVEGEAIRAEVVVHRDPTVNEIVSKLRGKRTMRPEAERELVNRLRKHETVVRTPENAASAPARTWSHLSAEVQAIDAKVTVIVPLYSATATYGALVAFYSEREYDPNSDLMLLEEIAARASVAVERAEALDRERRIATTLQRASLPTLIPKPVGLRFDVVYLPAGEEGDVGGDWYDAIELDDGSIVISTGDVTGRGIEAAAIMSKVRHAMAAVPRHESDPGKILDSAAWFLGKRYPDALVTAFVAIISPDRRMLRYANAGHPRPLLRRKGEVIELCAEGLPLGVRQLDRPSQTRSTELREGDLLVLYTDGLVESDRDMVEGQRVLHLVVSSDAVVASITPAKLIERACLRSIPHDDVAILTVAVGISPIWSFVAEDARAAAEARSQFAEFLRTQRDDREFVSQSELVFGELLGNVVTHSPGPVEIQVFQDDRGIILHVIDSGSTFDFSRRLPSDVLSEGGRGLFIVQHLAREVSVEHVAHCGNHITVRL